MREALLPACLLALLPAAAPGAAEEPIRSAEELVEWARARAYTLRVRIEPTRTATPGRCLDLGPDDLRVVVRGRRVEGEGAVRLEREPRPTLHAILVDTSGSMLGQLEHVGRAASEYLRRLDPERDRAMVMSFDDTVRLVTGATPSRERLIAGVRNLRLGEMTALHDALFDVLLEIGAHRERPVVLLLTDGVDTASLRERLDVQDLARRRPDLTVFTMGLGLPMITRAGPPGLLSTRKFLQRLASGTNGEFFDVPVGSRLDGVYARIKELLESEATLEVVDPEPEAEPAAVSVSSLEPGCRVKVYREREPAPADPSREPIVEPSSDLPRSFPLPAPVAVKPGVMEAAVVDPACAGEADRGGRVEVTARGLRGCWLDVSEAYGLLYDPFDPEGDGWTAFNGWLGLRMRPFEVELPSLETLPAGPEEVMDRLAEAAFARADFPVDTDPRKVPLEIHARPYHDLPLLADGERFLEARPRLARAIHARPDYRAWVLEKLRREADADLRAMIERWRRRFPAAPPEVVEAAARDSAEGSEILARGSTPREVDLERHLCAWLGDIPAHDLFVRWEVVRIERRLAEGPAAVQLDGVLARWRALRKVLFVPSYARVLAILSPVRDRETDRIGFWRLLLPRPSWLLQRVKDERAPPELVDLPLDLIPDLPLGLWLVDHLDRSRPEVTARWREENRRVVSLAYELRGKPRTRDPDRGFRETRVRMVLESTLAPRVELTADLSLDGSEREPRLLGLSLQQGDVREVLGPSAGPLVPHEVVPADHRDRDVFDP